MNGRVKLILYVIVVANIASSENVKSFKYVKGESEGYTNSSKDQELKLKGTIISLDDKNLGRKRANFDEAFERNMDSSRKINNYNDIGNEIYKPNMDNSIYWGNQNKNDELTIRQNSNFNDRGNDRNVDEIRTGYQWANEKDMGFTQDSNIYSNDYQTNRPNMKIEEETRPKPDWENFGERQTAPPSGYQNPQLITDSYLDLRDPYKYSRRDYMTEMNNREMVPQNVYSMGGELANTLPRYPIHRIYNFNNDDDNFHRSNFYKTDKGLIINLKTECPRENKPGIVHKIFFSSQPHINSFAEPSATYFPSASLISSNHLANPVYYL